MKKHSIIIFILLLSLSSFCQSDSIKNRDLGVLSDIIINNISIPDSIINKPYGETIVLEIHLKDKQVYKVEVWHKNTRFLYDMGRNIGEKIKTIWKPEYDFPEIILYPLCINFITDTPLDDKNKDFWFEILRNLNMIETKNFLILKPPTYFHAAKPYHKSSNEGPAWKIKSQ